MKTLTQILENMIKKELSKLKEGNENPKDYIKHKHPESFVKKNKTNDGRVWYGVYKDQESMEMLGSGSNENAAWKSAYKKSNE